jgi:SAM-dependent methyltransferase
MPLEAAEALMGRRDPLLPPRALRYVGRGDFRATGDEFLQHFIELGGLRPSDDVLDVGCGVGRMALPLTTFLDRHGSYTGLDIVPEAIRWSRRNITARFPAFNFELVDISNSRYNPDGTIDAASFRFPFPSASFDFVIATSLYTHLTPPATERYLAETSRVLRPGGRTLATFFLLDDDSLRAIEEGRAELGFVHRFGSARTLRPGDPEHAIALRAENVRHMFDAAGLDIQEPIYCGSWSGRTTARSYQDIIVACRSALDGS